MEIPPTRVVFDKEDIREIQARIDKILSSGMLAQGKYVQEFEQRWAEYVGTKYAIAVNSGSASIEICMRALGVEGRDVLVPDNTFIATALGVHFAGGYPRFVESDPLTFSVCLDELKKRFTPTTVGVIIVHIGGIITPEIESIRQWCDDLNLWLFEDCAHAHGSEYNGKRAGSFGIAGGYSFFATKVMTTGEGGMIVTNDDELAKDLRSLRNHGKPQPWKSYHIDFGSNYRMSELNAAIGLTQLKRLDEFISWRKNISFLYSRLLQDMPEFTSVVSTTRSSWYKYIVMLSEKIDRASLKQELKNCSVNLPGEVYEIPLHRQPIFQTFSNDEFPVTDDICKRHICLPLYYGMTDEEAQYVIESLKATASKC